MSKKKVLKKRVSAHELKVGQSVIKYDALSADSEHIVTKKLLDLWRNDDWFEEAEFDILA